MVGLFQKDLAAKISPNIVGADLSSYSDLPHRGPHNIPGEKKCDDPVTCPSPLCLCLNLPISAYDHFSCAQLCQTKCMSIFLCNRAANLRQVGGSWIYTNGNIATGSALTDRIYRKAREKKVSAPYKNRRKRDESRVA